MTTLQRTQGAGEMTAFQSNQWLLVAGRMGALSTYGKQFFATPDSVDFALPKWDFFLAL
jgi:hypothetical protein